jgi:hypothetical protein
MENVGLISPLMKYMKERNMIDDFGDEFADKVTVAEIDYTQGGATSIDLWKPYYFNPNHLLDHTNSIITGLEIVAPTQQAILDNAVTTNIPSSDLFGRAILWIVDGDNNVLIQTPLSSLLGVSYGGWARKVYQTHLTSVIWQKCYITWTNVTSLTVGQGLKLQVYYREKSEDQEYKTVTDNSILK